MMLKEHDGSSLWKKWNDNQTNFRCNAAERKSEYVATREKPRGYSITGKKNTNLKRQLR